MAAASMATAAGAMVILYYILNRRLAAAAKGDEHDDDNRIDDESKSSRSSRKKIARRPAQAPGNWLETISTLSETLRFTYSETLGKWPIGDLAFGINYLIRRQGDLPLSSVYAGSDCVQLRGPDIINELKYFVRLVTICMFFSKKPFPVFLESTGFSEDDVLLQERKAGILKPAFTILCDQSSKCFLLVIRGTHSIKDTLTAATGAVVPFHHSVLHEGGISNLVLGYAHCGMVAAARWIAKLSTPCLLKALDERPDYKIRIVGHSLGGGTAALLTYILREQKEFASSTCITFAPAACMTWELAESGTHFVTAIVNNSDLVPSFSPASVDDLRSEVTESSWMSDLRDQVERTRALNVVFRSASAIGSRLPSIAKAKARVAGAGALLSPVSSRTQVVMKRAQNVAQAVARTRPTLLSSWSCMGAHRRNVVPSLITKEEDTAEAVLISGTTLEAHSAEILARDPEMETVGYASSSGESGHDTDEEGHFMCVDTEKDIGASHMEAVTQGELWLQLEKELNQQEEDAAVEIQEEEAVAVKEIIEEANVLAYAVHRNTALPSSDVSESCRFYPPGRIMHLVTFPSPDHGGSADEDSVPEHVGIYGTPRHLYSKLRLTKTMIKDHYMPMYKRSMELVIYQLENEEAYVYVSCED
ncbi:Diacylglycerol lipase-alpha-like protein [Drosera capensis]